MLLQSIRKKIIKRLAKTVSRWHDKPLPPATTREKELAAELIDAFRKCSSTGITDCSPEWRRYIKRLRGLILNDDPREFLRWHVVSGTMFVKHAAYISPELKYLKSRPDWKSRWHKIIKETHTGHPVPYWRHPQSSGNLIHHAYHLAKFEEVTGSIPGSTDFILEFGGGYGSMCRVLHNAGFQGKYVIFDLPEFSALQRFYLKSIGLRLHSANSYKTAKNGVICISDTRQLESIIADSAPTDDPMFIATWSISESPIKLRNLILPLISGYNRFLIAYQDQFDNINNVDFFSRWKETQLNIEWNEWKISQLPNNRYLVGKRKNKHP